MQNFIQFAQSSSSTSSGDALLAGFAILNFLFGLIFLALLIATIVYWVIALVHVLQHQDVKDRVVWIIILLCVGSISGFIYYFVVKRPYDKGGMRDPNFIQK